MVGLWARCSAPQVGSINYFGSPIITNNISSIKSQLKCVRNAMDYFLYNIPRLIFKLLVVWRQNCLIWNIGKLMAECHGRGATAFRKDTWFLWQTHLRHTSGGQEQHQQNKSYSRFRNALEIFVPRQPPGQSTTHKPMAQGRHGSYDDANRSNMHTSSPMHTCRSIYSSKYMCGLDLVDGSEPWEKNFLRWIVTL